MRVFKNLSHTTISNWFKKHPFWSLFWVLYVKSQRFWASVFTELYQKVRKLTEGQKCPHRTIWRVLVQFIRNWALITQNMINYWYLKFMPLWGRTEWTATQFDTHNLNERPVEFLWRTATDFGGERSKIYRRTATDFGSERSEIYRRTATDFGGERPRTLEANGNPYKINCFIIW